MTTLAEVLAEGQGAERSFNCHIHEDQRASASVNVEKGLWYCFGCNASGKVGSRKPLTTKQLHDLLMPDQPPQPFDECWLDIYDSSGPCPYWAERVGPEIARQFRCGTHPLTGNPTYPLRDQFGRPIGVVQRTDGTPKYLYPPNVSVTRSMFGIEHVGAASTLVLVEGASDVMALYRSGLPAGMAALGLYGSSLHRPQTGLLAYLSPSRVVVGLDADEAGRRGAEAAVTALQDYAFEVVSVDWSKIGANDPGDVEHPTQLLEEM